MALGHMAADIMINLHNLKLAIWTNDKKVISQLIIFLMHHALVVTFIISVFKMGNAAMFMCYLFIVYDISSIFYALRNMLRDIGLKRHPLTKIFEMLFVIIFIISRIGWGSVVIGWSLLEIDREKCPLSIKVQLCIFQMLNYYWAYLLIKMALCKMIKIDVYEINLLNPEY